MVPEIDRRKLLAAALLLLTALPQTARAQQTAPPPQPTPEDLTPRGPVSIDVTARPMSGFDLHDRSQTMFGKLQFRSGLVLTSSFRGFGGLSAFRVDETGERFVALSDKGAWFTGRIVYDGREMTALAQVEVAPILGPDGQSITTRRWYDTEAIARDGGTLYVGIERANQILKFEFGRDGVAARGQPMTVPPNLRKLPNNKGLEALVVLRKGAPMAGALLAISERGLDADGNIVGALIGGPKPGALAVRRTENYDISDAALLPNGDVLLLERKFSWLGGVGIRIRRVPVAMVLPGAVLDGPSIFDADLGHEIDNMEGLDTHVTPDGDIVLTMISDDNFSMIQRTLLLQFTLTE